jgi:hypothetical protein
MLPDDVNEAVAATIPEEIGMNRLQKGVRTNLLKQSRDCPPT